MRVSTEGPSVAVRVRSRALAVALVLGFAGTASAQPVTSVRWGGKDPTPGKLVVGPPDMRATTVSPTTSVTVSDFRCARQYANLAALLGVGPDVLSRADVLAFELNGGHPGEHGGWESADWIFDDGVVTYRVVWDAVAGAATPAEALVAEGSLTAASYRAFFGITGGTDTVVSYQLLRLPAAMRTDSTSFRVNVRGFASGEGTPDPDAIGVLNRPCS